MYTTVHAPWPNDGYLRQLLTYDDLALTVVLLWTLSVGRNLDKYPIWLPVFLRQFRSSKRIWNGIHVRKRELDRKWSFKNAQMLIRRTAVFYNYISVQLSTENQAVFYTVRLFVRDCKMCLHQNRNARRLFQRAMKKWTFWQNSRAKMFKKWQKKIFYRSSEKRCRAFRFWCQHILQSLTKSETNVNTL